MTQQSRQTKSLNKRHKLQNGEQNWAVECSNCGSLPTVAPTDLCGPCCFGEADTAGGNW